MKQLTGYIFKHLTNLESLQQMLLDKGNALKLMGTILIGEEGVNLSVTGDPTVVKEYEAFLRSVDSLKDITLRYYKADKPLYDKFVVRIREEIVSIGESMQNLQGYQKISPATLHQWYGESKNFHILDVRNDYEIGHGAFKGTKHLGIKNFRDFPSELVTQNLDKNQPYVICCTGGIRCEKAAKIMAEQGFSNVYQVEGGILNYFNLADTQYYQGNCFVFDNRMIIDKSFNTVSA